MGQFDFGEFRCLSFDCYGTMINWETGILEALHPVLARHQVGLSDTEILSAYMEFAPARQRREYRTYSEILKGVVADLGDRFSFRPSVAEMEWLPNSLSRWLPIPDTVAALRRLRKKFQLAVISNIDDDLFATTARLLEVPFDHVITAQQARSYKPSHNNFRLALERIGVPREQLLHVAESLSHDIAPCNQLGIYCVWVNRRGFRHATPSINAQPDLEVADLISLADCAAP